jgi:hypothetical protein
MSEVVFSNPARLFFYGAGSSPTRNGNSSYERLPSLGPAKERAHPVDPPGF